MAGLSTYLVAQIFNTYFKATDVAYVGLHTANPTDAGTTGEVTASITGAGRPEVTFGSIVSKVIENDAAVSFGNSAAAQTVTHFSVWDAPSGGNCLGTGSLAASRDIEIGDPVVFPIGEIAVDLA
jgi:hypothetical protein